MSEFEELVLLTVASMPAETAYGLAVQEALQKEAGRLASLASIHGALYRMERRGLLRSDLGGATHERGGRRKRLFTVTTAGLTTLRQRCDLRTRLWQQALHLHPGGTP